jgi:hypothetical protein
MFWFSFSLESLPFEGKTLSHMFIFMAFQVCCFLYHMISFYFLSQDYGFGHKFFSLPLALYLNWVFEKFKVVNCFIEGWWFWGLWCFALKGAW